MSNRIDSENRFTTVVVNEVHTNVSQEIIEITADKLTIILSNHLSCLERSREWHTPLSLLLTIVLVLITAKFETAIGVSADTWYAIFIIGSGLCLLWLVSALFKISKVITVAELMKIIKNQV